MAGDYVFSAKTERSAMNRSTRHSIKMANSALQAGADAAATVAARIPGLLTQGFDPTGAKLRESHRMVHEKMSAVCEGALAAQLAWGGFLFNAALGGVRTPDDLSLALARVAQAAVAPAHRTVRANARRLSTAVGC
jgi:hypothetical protein